MDVLAASSRIPLVDPLIAAPAVGVAVVEGAGLAPREHGVGLGQLAEPLLGLRPLGHVGMPVACLGLEGPANLLLVRIARHAQDLVVIAFHRSHHV